MEPYASSDQDAERFRWIGLDEINYEEQIDEILHELPVNSWRHKVYEWYRDHVEDYKIVTMFCRAEGFEMVENAFAGKSTPEEDEVIEDFRNILAQLPVPEETFEVYRGVKDPLERVWDVEQREFPFSGSFSFSLSISYSNDMYRPYRDPVFYKVVVPAFSNVGYHHTQQQVIFPRGKIMVLEPKRRFYLDVEDYYGINFTHQQRDNPYYDYEKEEAYEGEEPESSVWFERYYSLNLRRNWFYLRVVYCS